MSPLKSRICRAAVFSAARAIWKSTWRLRSTSPPSCMNSAGFARSRFGPPEKARAKRSISTNSMLTTYICSCGTAAGRNSPERTGSPPPTRSGAGSAFAVLYTATLFQYGGAFLDRLGPALELGRSFVRQEYQKGFAPLLLLWKGIGAYVGRNPQYKILFGPVSISNQYEAVSRELMVSFLEKYALLHDWAGLVRNRCAFRSRLLRGAHRPAFPASGFDIEDLSAMVGDLERKNTGVPVLLRQYLRLGGKLLGFNVDPKFANALDGLILVDLAKTEPKLLQRYLGTREANAFLEFQKGNHGTH